MITITISGKQKEIRKWLKNYQQKMNAKINYVYTKGEDGNCTAIIHDWTKENYPRIRIVKKMIEDDQKRPARDSSESMESSTRSPGS